jgi:hypothetical protein
MLTFFFIILPILLVVHVIRLFTRPFRYSRRYGSPFYGGYGNGYGYGPGYGRRHHHRGLGGGLFSILALVALDRIFSSRRY